MLGTRLQFSITTGRKSNGCRRLLDRLVEFLDQNDLVAAVARLQRDSEMRLAK
jgi:hypothetical protein